MKTSLIIPILGLDTIMSNFKIYPIFGKTFVLDFWRDVYADPH